MPSPSATAASRSRTRTAFQLDVLTLDPTITPDAVGARRAGQDLVLDIQQTGDTITVKNHFNDDDYYTIDRIEFGDGTVWTDADIA